MKTLSLRFVVVFYLVCALYTHIASGSGPYKPTWESLDARPLPQWYDDSKIGIFIHWGVFSVPSFGSEWFWYYWKTSKSPNIVKFMERNYKPNFTYAEFAPHFTAELYDPKHWAQLFKKSGAKYVVLTSKHHEGYTLWPSKNSWNWNAMDVGPNRDLINDLSIAVRETGLKFGLYHSLFEWFNFLFISDRNSGFKQQYFPKTKTLPELYDIVNTYKPEVIWSDGDGGGDDEYWNSRYFLQWLYNESPVKETVVTNDRWGSNTLCKHGGYWTCTDRFIPGKLLPRKWENAMTLDKNSWGYNRLSHINDYLTIDELLKTMAQTVSFGGNLLVNVGPTSDGRIVPIMEERLLQMGEWLGLNGEAIYKSKPWKYQNDTQTANVWYTSDKTSSTVYAIFFNWPENKVLSLASIAATNTTTISLITKNGDLRLKWIKSSQTTDITLPIIPPCNWAYTLKIEDY